jgi:hypothetical protein
MSSLTAPSSAEVIPFQPKPQSDSFIRLSRALIESPAWQSLPAKPRALYAEIANRFNGKNNGLIPYSERDGAASLRADRKTVRQAFDQLEEREIALRRSRGRFNLKHRKAIASKWFLPDLDRTHNGAPGLRTNGAPEPRSKYFSPLAYGAPEPLQRRPNGTRNGGVAPPLIDKNRKEEGGLTKEETPRVSPPPPPSSPPNPFAAIRKSGSRRHIRRDSKEMELVERYELATCKSLRRDHNGDISLTDDNWLAALAHVVANGGGQP